MRLALSLALVVMAGPALAAETTNVRMATHDGYGRVVFEFASPTPFQVDRRGDAVVLHFSGAGDVPAIGGSARNIVSVTGGANEATVTMTPGARLHTMQLGNRVVVDALDPAKDKPSAAAKPRSRAAEAASPAAIRTKPGGADAGGRRSAAHGKPAVGHGTCGGGETGGTHGRCPGGPCTPDPRPGPDRPAEGHHTGLDCRARPGGARDP